MVDYSIFEITDPEMIVSAHFPVYAEGKDAYYIIKDKDSNIVVSRRNTNIVDQSKGVFNVDIKSYITDPGTYIVIFDIDGTTLAAGEKVIVKGYEIEQRDFQEYNADKSVKKVIIKKTRTDNFDDAHITKELSFEYNSDHTVNKMEENKL